MNEAIGAIEEKNVEIKWKKEAPALFRVNYKGRFFEILLAVIAVLVALLLGLKKPFQKGSAPEASRSSSSVTIEDVWQNNKSPVQNDLSEYESDENSYDEIINDYFEGVDDYYSRQKSTKLDQWQGKNNAVSLTSGEVVDLGLSVNWASCNVGAASPEEAGGYFAWGETKEKDEYSEESYKYKESKYGHIQTKRIATDISGTKYDVARSILGGNYRMPTREEMKELILKCDWHYGIINGVSGMVVTGENGNCIFIPAVGHKKNMSTGGADYYWTSTAGEYGTPYCLHISAFPHKSDRDLVNYVLVEQGLPIRPVVSK